MKRAIKARIPLDKEQDVNRHKDGQTDQWNTHPNKTQIIWDQSTKQSNGEKKKKNQALKKGELEELNLLKSKSRPLFIWRRIRKFYLKYSTTLLEKKCRRKVL